MTTTFLPSEAYELFPNLAHPSDHARASLVIIHPRDDEDDASTAYFRHVSKIVDNVHLPFSNILVIVENAKTLVHPDIHRTTLSWAREHHDCPMRRVFGKITESKVRSYLSDFKDQSSAEVHHVVFAGTMESDSSIEAFELMCNTLAKDKDTLLHVLEPPCPERFANLIFELDFGHVTDMFREKDPYLHQMFDEKISLVTFHELGLWGQDPTHVEYLAADSARMWDVESECHEMELAKTVTIFDPNAKYIAYPVLGEPFLVSMDVLKSHRDKRSYLYYPWQSDDIPPTPAPLLACPYRGIGSWKRWGENHTFTLVAFNPKTERVYKRRGKGEGHLLPTVEYNGEILTALKKLRITNAKVGSTLRVRDGISCGMDGKSVFSGIIYRGFLANPRNTRDAWEHATIMALVCEGVPGCEPISFREFDELANSREKYIISQLGVWRIECSL